jgi:protein-tyrosine-phosphatase
LYWQYLSKRYGRVYRQTNFTVNFYIESAGVESGRENFYQPYAIDVINETFNTDLKQLPSKNINDVDLSSFDKLYVLDKGMWEKLRNRKSLKHLKGKLFCYHIDDPFENDEQVYRDTFDDIMKLIIRLAKKDFNSTLT